MDRWRLLVGCALLAAAPAAAAPKAAAPARAAVGPSPPAISISNNTHVTFTGEPARVRIAWAPVAGAASYRARVIEPGKTTDHILDGTTTSFSPTLTAPGHHQISVFAIDANGVESAPADVPIDVVAIDARAPAATATYVPERGAVALGAQLASRGLRCQLGKGTSAPEVIATTIGAHQLRCGGEPGQPVIELPIIVAPVIVTADSEPLRRGNRETIHVMVASVGAIGDQLVVEPVGDVVLGTPIRTEVGLDVPITAGAGTAEAGLVVLAGATELGRIELAVTDPPPMLPPSRSAWFAVDLGTYAGALTMPHVGSSANRLGKPLDPADTLTSGPLAGVRIGLFPTRRVGVELETAIATPSYVGRLGVAAVWLSRVQLAARAVEDGRFGLRGLIGGDLLTVLTNAGTTTRSTLGGVHYGAAFSIETRRDVSVRLQALHVITVAQDAGYAHCLELQLGVVVRLGRRDRWN